MYVHGGVRGEALACTVCTHACGTLVDAGAFESTTRGVIVTCATPQQQPTNDVRNPQMTYR